MQELILTSEGCSCLTGDFNVVRKHDERKESIFHQHRAAAFNKFINIAGLLDLNLGGRRFTWIGMDGIKLNKLDRFLVSPLLLSEWPAVSVVALERSFTDHCPVLLK